jgi:hypothetical protein
MPSIIPSYDFGVNAIPTYDTLVQQANSLQVTGLTIRNIIIEGSIFGEIFGDTSGATQALIGNSTAHGTIWCDAQSNLWVMERSGPIKLFRYEGGWESRRAHIEPDAINPTYRQPGVTVWIDNIGTEGRIAENFIREESPVNTRASGTQLGFVNTFNSLDIFLGLLLETGATGHPRWCGRGGSWLYDQSHVTNTWNKLRDLQNNYRLWRPNASGSEMFRKEYVSVTLAVDRYYGWVMVPGPEATKVSQADGDHIWRIQWMNWYSGPLGTPRRT